MTANSQLPLILRLKLFLRRKTRGCLPVSINSLVLSVMLLLPADIAAKNTCRFVPALSREKFTELKCNYDDATNTLTCEGNSVAGTARSTSQYTLKYPNKTAFVQEGVFGQILHTSRTWGFSSDNGGYDESQQLTFENGRLVRITIIPNEDINNSKQIDFSDWDKSGRPITGWQNRELCSTSKGDSIEMREIPVKITYNEKSRKRITVLDFGKAQPVELAKKCKAARLSLEESFDYPFGKAKGNDCQKICIE